MLKMTDSEYMIVAHYVKDKANFLISFDDKGC